MSIMTFDDKALKVTIAPIFLPFSQFLYNEIFEWFSEKNASQEL